MDYAQLATDILKHVGGEGNISSVGHCTTRLRFKIKNKNLVNKEALNKLPEVIRIMDIAGQLQIVIGMEVVDVYREVMIQTNLGREDRIEESEHKGSILNQAIDIITGIFTPLLGVLTGAGILKGLLIVLTASGLLEQGEGTYLVLHAASDSMFYFLPMLLAITSARKFGADPYVSVAIAGALVYPELMEAYSQNIEVSFLGIPILMTSYATSVIPIVLAIFATSKLQAKLNKWYPAVIKTFFTPLTILAVMVPLTLLVFGPFGTYVGDLLAEGYSFLYEGNRILAGAFMGFFWQIFVIFGVHWGVIPIAINNLSNFGIDTLSSMVTPAIFAQVGATLGVWLKTKQLKTKAIAAPATIAGLFGVTEPAIYGINLPYKRPFFIGCSVGALGGALAAVSGAGSKSIALPGLTTLPVFFGEGFGMFIVSVVGAFVLAAIVTFLFGFKEEQETELLEVKAEKSSASKKAIDEFSVLSPLTGAVISLEYVEDEVFSSGAVGQGLAIVPVEGKLYAPFHGTVTSVFPTNHAIGVTSGTGIQLLIHIGIHTVQLEGEYFQLDVEQGDVIEPGQLLGTFDIESISGKGYDLVTPIVITNSEDYLDVIASDWENVEAGDRIVTVVK